jgi:CRISPR system Cascade subunit CasB
MTIEPVPFKLGRSFILNAALLTWWQHLQQQTQMAEPATQPEDVADEAIASNNSADFSKFPPPASTAARAELRRLDCLADVMVSPHYQRLYQWLVQRNVIAPITDTQSLRPYQVQQLKQLALLVGLLALIRKNVSGKNGELMSAGEGQPVVSELRFRRLLASTDLDDLYGQLRRIIPLMKHQLNVRDLIAEIGQWDSEVMPTPQTWAYAYHWA